MFKIHFDVHFAGQGNTLGISKNVQHGFGFHGNTGYNTHMSTRSRTNTNANNHANNNKNINTKNDH